MSPIGCRIGVRAEAGDTLWSGQVAATRHPKSEEAYTSDIFGKWSATTIEQL